MNGMKFVLTAALLVAVALGAGAQTAPAAAPGYVDVAKLGIPADIKPEVEVFLETPLLKMLAGASSEITPQLGEIAKGLNLVQVKVYGNIGSTDQGSAIQANVAALLEGMLAEGWSPVVRVPEDNVNFLMKTNGDYIAGLFGLVADGSEIVFINVVGNLEPEATGQLLGQIGLMVTKGQVDMGARAALMGLVMGGPMGQTHAMGQTHENVEITIESEHNADEEHVEAEEAAVEELAPPSN